MKEALFWLCGFGKVFNRVPRELIRWHCVSWELKNGWYRQSCPTYSGIKTVVIVRTVYGNSNGFEVKVGMHQGSALSHLLFVIVMEALSREFRVTLPWELLCADDLVVISETEDDLIKRLNEWKDNVENRGMRVNMNGTKVMISREWQKVTQKAVRWPCGVCGSGVGSNSIQCTSCQKWVHRKYGGIKGSMYKVMKIFVCRGCMNPVTGTGCTNVQGAAKKQPPTKISLFSE